MILVNASPSPTVGGGRLASFDCAFIAPPNTISTTNLNNNSPLSTKKNASILYPQPNRKQEMVIPLPLRWFGNIESSRGLNRRDERGRRVEEQDEVTAVPLVAITETAARE